MWSKIGIALAAIVLTVVVSELVLRMVPFDSDSDAFRIWPPNLVQKFAPAPEAMPGINDTSIFTISSIGFRAREYSDRDKYKILALGGSTTECLYLDDSETWPTQLQKLLLPESCWVGNGGRAGYGSRHHVLQAKHLLKQHPEIDLVIFMVGVNDFLHFVEGNEIWKAEWSEEEYLSKTFLLIPQSYYSPWYRRTRIWQLGQGVIRERNRNEYAELVQDEAGDLYTRWRKARQAAPEILMNLPELEPALKDYAANIKQVCDYAKESGQRIMFIDQPCMWSDSMDENASSLLCAGAKGDRKQGNNYYAAEALQAGLKKFNEKLREVAEANGAAFYSIADSLPKTPEVFYDDMHFNESGARKVAELIAPAVKKELNCCIKSR